MSENNSVDFFKQLGVERTDLLIAEQSQVVKSIQNAINKLDKAQRRLRGDLEMYQQLIQRGGNDIKDRYRFGLETISVDVGSLSHAEIITILKEHPESWFSASYGDVELSYKVERTSEQEAEAIKQVQDRYQPKIDKANADREANTKQLKQLHAERTKESQLLGEMKRIRNVVFGNTRGE